MAFPLVCQEVEYGQAITKSFLENFLLAFQST